MGKFKSFEEIISWQKSRLFNKQIYLLTDRPEFRRDFDFVRQIRRASLSISTNIAEGYERRTDKEFTHFLFIAKGSAAEVRSLLYLASDLGYIQESDFEQLKDEVSQISKYISSFIKYLNVQT
jgi:four helix bundle protein